MRNRFKIGDYVAIKKCGAIWRHKILRISETSGPPYDWIVIDHDGWHWCTEDILVKINLNLWEKEMVYLPLAYNPDNKEYKRH